MIDEGVPDRRIGLVVGIAGGILGTLAMRRYTRAALPRLFPDAGAPARLQNHADPLEARAPFGRQYETGETVYQSAGRHAYRLLRGDDPPPQARLGLGDWMQWAFGIMAGVAYAATRTSTLPRDIAGGFFYGIRLWLTDEIAAPLLGLRAGPTRFSARQHFALLTVYWAYTFVTTNSTRLLYRLVTGDRHH